MKTISISILSKDLKSIDDFISDIRSIDGRILVNENVLTVSIKCPIRMWPAIYHVICKYTNVE